MLRILGVLGGLGIAAAGIGQSPSPATVLGVTTEIKRSVDQTDGQYLIANESNAPIVAMHFRYGCGDLKTRQLFDVLVNYGTEHPIPYQKTWTSGFGSPEILSCPGGVDAAIFADGHTEGEQKKVEEIYHERRGVYDGIAFVLPLLDAVVRSDTQKEEALLAISNKVAEMGNKPPDDRPALWGETGLLRVVTDTLEKERPMGIPSDMTPSEQAVEQVMKNEHLSHASAAAFAIRARLLTWQRDLAGNLGAPQEAAR